MADLYAINCRDKANSKEKRMAGLKARETDARDEEIERLKAVLGEMTMRCELQRDAIRRLKAGLPLDETRLPK